MRSWVKVLMKMGLLPATMYLGMFAFYSYPALGQFHTHFFADQGDGLQNVWNLWWVNKAVTELHQSPWHTQFLHWPYGTSLLGHTLNPFNGFLAIPLLRFLTLIETHNLIVVFSFVAGGLNAFLLAHDLVESYAGSLLAGFIFTFSSYHFAHAEGHLPVVSLEWIPLFLLLWWRLVSRPTIPRAVGAAAVLFLVILCDYYYFLYCVLAGTIILLWHAARSGGVLRSLRAGWAAFSVFAAVAMATSGALVGSLLWFNATDPLSPGHNPETYSLDLLAPFIPGGHWRFASLTQPYWSKLPGNIHESSVYVGLSVLFLLVYAWRKRGESGIREIRLLFFLMLFFALLALGPSLHVWGKRVPHILLPYGWLVWLFPLLRVSGVPVRMMVMVMLIAGVIGAAGLKLLLRAPRGRVLVSILLAVLVVEYFPKRIPLSEVPIPSYVLVLRAQPSPGGALDTASSTTQALFYQTIHDKPLAFGYLARLPRSVVEQDRRLATTLAEGRFAQLWREYQIRYLLVRRPSPALGSVPGVRTLWSDGETWLFDLSGTGAAAGCPRVADPPRGTPKPQAGHLV